MTFEPRFVYPKLEATTLEDGSRTYATVSGHLPSVTTILSKTSDQSGLIEWRRRVGEVAAKREMLEATNLGTLMHRHVECHLLGIPRPSGSNVIHNLARNMSDVIIESGLSRVSEVWGIESNLYFPGLYAGTSDLIAVYDGVPSICDFKSSKKIKSEDIIQNYFLQGAAYASAHNELFGTDITQVVIFMAARDCRFKAFVIRPDSFGRYIDKWVDCVGTFYAAQ